LETSLERVAKDLYINPQSVSGILHLGFSLRLTIFRFVTHPEPHRFHNTRNKFKHVYIVNITLPLHKIMMLVQVYLSIIVLI